MSSASPAGCRRLQAGPFWVPCGLHYPQLNAGVLSRQHVPSDGARTSDMSPTKVAVPSMERSPSRAMVWATACLPESTANWREEFRRAEGRKGRRAEGRKGGRKQDGRFWQTIGQAPIVSLTLPAQVAPFFSSRCRPVSFAPSLAGHWSMAWTLQTYPQQRPEAPWVRRARPNPAEMIGICHCGGWAMEELTYPSVPLGQPFHVAHLEVELSRPSKCCIRRSPRDAESVPILPTPRTPRAPATGTHFCG